MNEIKYTKDGRKVVVIGDLNQTEKIVQEIYVTADGAEIPQGERFVEKNLLDAPAKTWKETQLETIDKRYEAEKEKWDKLTRELENRRRRNYKAMEARIEWFEKFAKETGEEDVKNAVKRITDFLTCKYTYAVYQKWSEMEIVKINTDEYNDILERYEYGFSTPKLISLFGDSGKLDYRVNDYSDGSGSWAGMAMFCSYDEAVEYVQGEIDNADKYYDREVKSIIKYSLKYDSEKMVKYYEMKIETAEKNIEYAIQRQEENKNSEAQSRQHLQEYKAKLKELKP